MLASIAARGLPVLGCCLLVASIGLCALLTPWGSGLEDGLGRRVLFHLRGPLPTPHDVVIVSIDRASARRLNLPGHKPRLWPRTVHARLVERLAQHGAAAIGFDVIFDSPQTPADDAAFATALRRAGNVVLFEYLQRDDTHAVGITPRQSVLADALNIERRLPPLPLFTSAAAVAPFVLPKSGAEVRETWLYKSGVGDVPTLPTAMFMQYARAAAATSALQRVQHDLRHGPPSRIINFYGPARRVPTLSYGRALTAAPAELRRAVQGKAVFVGYSEPFQPDQKDNFYTVYTRPDGTDLSGVEIAATVFANLIEQRFLTTWTLGSEILLLAVWGALLGTLFYALPRTAALMIAVPLGALYTAGTYLAFIDNLWLPLAIPVLLQLPCALLAALTLRYARTQREREHLRQAYALHVPGHALEAAARGISGPIATPRYGVCLATDAEGYTALAVRLSPGALRGLMNDYFDALITILRVHGGYVTDIAGDALIAVWQDTPHAAHAHAARATLAAAQAARDFCRRHPETPLRTRMGLAAGQLLLADVGGQTRRAYRALGDTVNRAARLEGLNKQLGTSVLAQCGALEHTTDVVSRPLGRFRLVGRSEPVTVCELLGTTAETTPELQRRLDDFAHAHTLFVARNFTAAAKIFAPSAPRDGPSRYYHAWCVRYIAEAPRDDWDGVIALTSK